MPKMPSSRFPTSRSPPRSSRPTCAIPEGICAKPLSWQISRRGGVVHGNPHCFLPNGQMPTRVAADPSGSCFLHDARQHLPHRRGRCAGRGHRLGSVQARIYGTRRVICDEPTIRRPTVPAATSSHGESRGTDRTRAAMRNGRGFGRLTAGRPAFAFQPRTPGMIDARHAS